MSKLILVSDDLDQSPVVRPPAGAHDSAQPAHSTHFDEKFGVKLLSRHFSISLRIASVCQSEVSGAKAGEIRVSGLAMIYCMLWIVAILMFGMLCFLYLLKSGLGIDFFADVSMLHPIFEFASGR